MKEEHALLHEFTERRSETAFRELVVRYTDFVHSAAMRQAGAALAEDVTQQVFIDFARNAASLGRTPHLGGWLHRHTRFISLNIVRAEQRRVLRERIAMEIQDSQNDWQLIAPELDAAIDALDADDRTAVLARYFEKQDFAGIGAALGVSEGAAQRRVSRAVEKLRERLSARSVTAAALIAMLTTQGVEAAPAHLAATAAGAGWVAIAGTAKATMGWLSAKAIMAGMATILAVAGAMWISRAGGEIAVAAAQNTPPPAPVAALPAKALRPDAQRVGVWNAAKFSWMKPDAALRKPVVFNVTIPSGHSRFTVVVENADSVRVRNLLDAAKVEDFGGTPQSGQPQTLALEWNGLNDRGEPVADGEYRVRGCSHPGVTLAYDYSLLGPGTPPWEGYKNSTWGGDHEFPNAIACVPGGGAWRVVIGGRTAEGGSPGFVLDANDRKVHAFGNGWTGPNALAVRDGAVWIALGRELVRIEAHTSKVRPFARPVKFEDKELRIHALAVGEKTAALVLRHKQRDKEPAKAKPDRLLILDKTTGETLRDLPLDASAAHNGLAFARDGALLFSTDTGLMRLDAADANAAPQPLKLEGIEKPAQLATDKDGRLFVMDEGADAQVKVFDAEGKFVRAIGTRGGQQDSAFEAAALHRAEAISVADDGALWVAEGNGHEARYLGFARRIAVFNADGKFSRHFIGGTWYGANQVCLHEQDPSLAYAYGLVYRVEPGKKPGYTPLRYASSRREPRSPFELWTGSPGVLFGATRMFRSDASGTMREYLLQSNGFPILYAADASGDYRPVFAAGTHEHNAAFPKADDDPKAVFLWSDANGDEQSQPEEFVRVRGGSHSVAWFSGWGYPPPRDFVWRFGGWEFSPARFTPQGAPVYSQEKARQLAKPAHFLRVGQHLIAGSAGKWDSPEAGYYFAGRYHFSDLDGRTRATYRYNWPAVHASWSSTLYQPGDTGRTIGENFFSGIADSGGEIGHVIAAHGNYGQAFVFSEDGLFVTPLFRDPRDGPKGQGDTETFGADWTDVTMNQEAFGGWFGRQDDGKLRYLFGHTAAHVVRVEGLEKVTRFAAGPVQVRASADAAAAPAEKGTAVQTLRIPNVRGAFPAFAADGDASKWRDIPRREIRLGENVVARVALAHDLDNLYLLAEVADPSPAMNAAREPYFIFKSGDALDLQFGPLRPARTAPGEGDVRIVIAPGAPDAKGKATCTTVLYRPVKADAKPGESVTFESPVRSVKFASVRVLDDAKAVFTKTATGYTAEVRLKCDSIALKNAASGLRIRGDIGVLFSNDGGEATQTRAYLSDHSPGASITADVPTESEIRPAEWSELLLE